MPLVLAQPLFSGKSFAIRPVDGALGAMLHAQQLPQEGGGIYLLLNVVQDQKRIEKHGKLAGVDIDVDWVKLSGGSAVNDALLSGSIDVAGAGKQNVKRVASLGNFPYYLVSTNRKGKTSADFTAAERIALSAVTVSVQARLLQMAAAKKS